VEREESRSALTWRGAGGAGLASAGCRKAGGKSASRSACGPPADTGADPTVGAAPALGGRAAGRLGGADALNGDASSPPTAPPSPPPVASGASPVPRLWLAQRGSSMVSLWL
jgi:hypothetical protein